MYKAVTCYAYVRTAITDLKMDHPRKKGRNLKVKIVREEIKTSLRKIG